MEAGACSYKQETRDLGSRAQEPRGVLLLFRMTETLKGPGAPLLRCSSVLTAVGRGGKYGASPVVKEGSQSANRAVSSAPDTQSQGKLQRAHLQNVARLALRLYNFVILKLFIIFPAKDLASGHCRGIASPTRSRPFLKPP